LIISGEFELSKKVRRPVDDQDISEKVTNSEVEILKTKIRGEK